jgi:hypothetical protein
MTLSKVLLAIAASLCFCASVQAQGLPIRNDVPTQLRSLGADLNVGANFAVNRFGQLQCLSVVGAGGATSANKLEDSAHADGDAGTYALAVRDDDLSQDSGADGDYQSLRSDSVGRLYVNAFGGDVNRFLVACSGIATGTADQPIISAVVGNRIYVTSLSCVNTAAAVASFLTLKDGSTGKWNYYLSAATATLGNNQFHVVFPTPIRGTANTVMQFAMTTTATSTSCCATYFTSGN